MSDDERSDSSSDSEDIETTGLIATRQKRATAGNLYATLRANLDDEDLQKELLAEDEEGDAGEYEGSDKGGEDDDELESSSEEEDAGPPQEGQQEDLEGEKALKRQERVEAKKKRKLHEARLKLPVWRKKKSVKLADDVKTEDGSTSERPRKKSERSNWLPTAADAPIRQSGRASAVANREIVHANLKQSAERSERQRRVMKDAAEREKTKRRMTDMTQEERLKKCEKIERETAKEFGRWEREEAERQRLREEALAAKRKRGLEGSFIRSWSGSVLWEGDKIKVKRMNGGKQMIDEIEEDKKEVEGADGAGEGEPSKEVVQESNLVVTSTDNAPGETAQQVNPDPSPTAVEEAPRSTAMEISTPQAPQTQAPGSWLEGIQEYAAQPAIIGGDLGYLPSAPAIYAIPPTQPQQSPQIYHGWPATTHQLPGMQSTLLPQPPPPPPIPLVREQAQRTLLILENFPSLETTTTVKRIPKYKQTDTTLEADPIKTLLLPNAFPVLPQFTSEESKYLLSRPRKRAGNEVPLPTAPVKRKCALTSWPAKFRDPKTGLAYADMHQYKAIQRILAGGCAWSGLVGAWVGSSYGALGRPAKGVPEAFVSGNLVKTEESGS